MVTYLEDRLPIWEVAADHIVTKMGDTTLGFVLTKPEIFTLSSGELQQWHATWTRALAVLPPNTVVHLQDWYRQVSWQADFEKSNGGFLSSASNKYFHERPWLEHTSYCFISRTPARRAFSPGSALLNASLFPPDMLSSQALADFTAQVSQFERILTDSGLVQFRRLTTDDLASSPGKPGLIEQYCQLLAPGEAPILRDLDFDKGLRIGEKHCALFTLADAEHLPAQCSASLDYTLYSADRLPFRIGFASQLGLLLPCNHIYNQYIFIDDEQAARKKLEQRARHLHGLSKHSRENALTKTAIDEFLNTSITSQDQLVRAHFNILAWTEDSAGLQQVRNLVGAAIARLGATPHLETAGAPQIWCAGIPGNAADLPPYETIRLGLMAAVCFLAPDTNNCSSISPFGIRLGDRTHGRPLHVDLADEPMRRGMITNRNKFVLGGSGSGKSFFTNHLMRSYHEQGAHILVVDIGNSYQGLCTLANGLYFTYKEDAPLCFNPFWLPKGGSLDTEKGESIKTLLLALWKKEDETFLRSEYVALSNALQQYYERLAADMTIFPCFDSFYVFLRDEFADRLTADKVQVKDFDMNNLLYVLRPYYKGGEYDYLLNATNNLDLLAEPFIVFELDRIKEHPILFPVVTIIIMEVFISKMRQLPGIRKVILIEEAWKAIARQGMSEYIKYLFKTVRKFYGEAIVVTQEMDDIISSPVVKQAIINNADCKILLDQNKFRNRFDEIQDVLGLSDKDKVLALSVNANNDPAHKYKEVFISLGNTHSQVYRVEVSLEEYLTYTTEESEKIKVQAYARQYGSMRKGITVLTRAIRDGSIKLLLTGALALAVMLYPTHSQAQIPIADVIKEGIKKVIVAVDLEIQRLQTQTINLQDAQKQVENAMQLAQLSAITDWVRQQKDLYAEYYQELWQVKDAFTLYQRIKDITQRQTQLITGYKQSLALLRQDPNFSPDELQHMTRVYSSLLDRTAQNITQLLTVITGFATQMEDGDRLHIIDGIATQVDQNYADMQQFTQENVLLSLQRAKSQQDIDMIRALYNIK